MTTLFNRKPEIKTALLVILGISLFIFGFSFLKRSSIFENNKILPGSTKILVSMRIDKDLNFSPNSKAVFYEAGLIGGKAISIEPVFDSKNIIKSNDTIASDVKPGLTELKKFQLLICINYLSFI